MQVWHCNKVDPQDALELIWKTHFKSSADVQAQSAAC